MKKTGIFYGPEKGNVGKIAHLIADKLGADKCDLVLIKNSNGKIINPYDNLIFGISTLGRANWDSEHTDDDWDVFFTHLKEADWSGKQVAIYGLGDHINYADHFVDAIGWLYEKLLKLNVKVVGFCKTDDYDFTDSDGIEDGEFVGLPLDEDYETEKSEERLDKWLNRLKNEHGY